MPEPINNTVVVESLVRELCAVKLEIMECEPVGRAEAHRPPAGCAGRCFTKGAANRCV